MIPIVVFASGRGSNFEAILQAKDRGELSEVKILSLFSDQPQAGALKIAEKYQIPIQVIEKMDRDKDTYNEEILKFLKLLQPRFIVLAGYMRILNQRFIEVFRSERGYSRIVNIHPSLLPEFRGKDAYRRAFEARVQKTGVTVHLVEYEVDSGPICAQKEFPISDCHSWEEVEKKGLKIEHQLYPETLNWVLPEKFVLNSSVDPQRRVCVRQS